MWSTCGRGAISERRDDLGAYESVLPYEARPIISCRSTSATRPSAPFRFRSRLADLSSAKCVI